MCRTIYRPIVSGGGECPRGERERVRTLTYPGIVTWSPADDAFSHFLSFFTPYVDLEEEKHLLSPAGRDPARWEMRFTRTMRFTVIYRPLYRCPPSRSAEILSLSLSLLVRKIYFIKSLEISLFHKRASARAVWRLVINNTINYRVTIGLKSLSVL